MLLAVVAEAGVSECRASAVAAAADRGREGFSCLMNPTVGFPESNWLLELETMPEGGRERFPLRQESGRKYEVSGLTKPNLS
jgi:hypothetical protein